jgi:non-ribosomal peptide synthetase component F
VFAAAMLAATKAGACWVPLDPGLPAARLAVLLREAGIRAILAPPELALALPPSDVPVLPVATQGSAGATAAVPPVTGVEPGNPVYVIFTSGSTGTPKGVAVEHRQLVNYARAVGRRLDLPEGSSYATVSTFAADLGHTAIFPALCGGGTLHVVPEDRIADPDALARYLGERRVDVLKIVPSFFDVLLAGAEPALAVPVRRLVVGGEAASPGLAARVRALAPEVVTINHYGPTETTVDRRSRTSRPTCSTRTATPRRSEFRASC